MARRTSWLFRVLAAIVMPMAFITGQSSMGAIPALANGPCTGPTHRFDGQYSLNGTWGAMANIVVQNAAFCTGGSVSSNHISAWALVQGHDNADEVAQAGYIKRYGVDTVPQNFAEYDQTTNIAPVVKIVGGTPPLGSTNFYYDEYDTSAHVEDMVVNDTYLLQTNFDTNGTWSGPWIPEWAGEIHDTGDEMPGTSSARATFTGAQYEPNYGGGFVNPNNEIVVDSNAGGNGQGCQQWYDDTHFEIWHC